MFVPIVPQPTQRTPEQVAADAVARAERVGEPDPMAAESSTPIALAVLASLTAIAAIAGLLIAFTGTARAQGAPSPQATFLFIKGSDTIGVERANRSRESTSGTIVARGAGRITYTSARSATGGPAAFSLRAYGPGAPDDAPALQTGTIDVGVDSVVMDVVAGGSPMRFAKAASGRPLPLMNLSAALMEPIIARARGTGQNPATTPVFLVQGTGVVYEATVRFGAADSVSFTVGGLETRLRMDRDGQITGGTIPAQNVNIVLVTGAAARTISIGRPDYSAPASAPYTAEEVSVPTRAGHSLSGTLTMPRGAATRVPAVVTITGSGQQDRDEAISTVTGYRPFRQLADTLGRRGIAVLRLDDRGINGSGGDVANATSADFADDIRAAVTFLRSRANIDPERIALYGHSEGGMIAPMVAATDSKLSGIVLAAGPAYTGRKILDFQLRNLVMGNSAIPAASKDSAVKASFAQWDSTAGKAPWMKFFLDYDPLVTLRRVKVPVLIAQGGTDQQVTPEQAPIIERTLRESGNRQVTTKVFADRNHLFLDDPIGFPGDYAKLRNPRIGADVMGPVVEWLATVLRAPRLP
ncbi:MAG: alpha/beta fold hydrolase [Gemmatimonadota bacterium]|nr:alpha/beta fold hydrolase [Gemmatimonadota bacterium]